MNESTVLDLSACSEFRQTLEARPPRVVHGTAVVLVSLLAVALTWATLTRADLVVKAPGRVRPVTTPVKVFNPARGDVLSATPGGRVVEVRFREGDEVVKGQVLLRLDTSRIDHEIARRKRTLRSLEEALARTVRLVELTARQYESAKARAEAELAQGQSEARLAMDRQAADVRLAKVEQEAARTEDAQLRRLDPSAVSRTELDRARAKVREADEKLARASLPPDDSRIAVLRQALAVLEKDHALKAGELERDRETRQGEVDAARIELAGLEQERDQAVLRAPMDGVVISGDVKVGDLLEPGKPAIEIAEQRGFVFEASVPSEEVGHLQVGMPARLRLDAYDHQKYGTAVGVVTYISPDSGVAEGSPSAFYVVRIALEGDEVGRGEYRGKIRLGMAGQVEVVTEEERLLFILVKKIRKAISLG